MKTRILVVVCVVLLAGEALQAQTSASYQISDMAINAGGVPAVGQEVVSPGYRITLASVGEVVAATGLVSSTYRVDLGAETGRRAPTEVTGLVFDSAIDLTWSADPSAGVYHLYRESMSGLTGPGYGQCFRQALTGTTATDTDVVAANDGYFYLVTVENRLGEEGTKGFRSDTTERQGTACP